MRGISLTLTVCVLSAFWFATKDLPTADSAGPFHAKVGKEILDLPTTLGNWTLAEKVEPPPAAQQLLRPNALTARIMRNSATGKQATLIVVQCRDARDMAGHYPPNCYPAHGWQWRNEPLPAESISITSGVTTGESDIAAHASDGGTNAREPLRIPYQVYDFKRVGGVIREKRIRIFSFFAIPGTGLVPDIKSVKQAAEDYRVRPYGAAQIQVIVDGYEQDSDSKAIFEDVMKECGSLLHVLSDDPLSTQVLKPKSTP